MREKLTTLFGSHLINLDILPDAPIVIDAGACVGKCILEIQEHIKNPAVFAIEPNMNNAFKLRNIEDIIVIEAALVGSKEPKEMRFYDINGLPEWGNVTGLYASKKHTEYMIETINLKNVLDTIPLETIHYLKMDIEGSEWDVVSDMNEDTAKRIEQISMEIHSHLDKITEKLEAIGYKIYFDKGELYGVKEDL